MKYLRHFTINTKQVEEFSQGYVNDMVFVDTGTGKKYDSFIDLLEKQGRLMRYISHSTGTENYHHTAGFSLCVYTDEVSKFIKENECFWFIDLINSFALYTASTLAKVDKTGRIEWCHNIHGKDDFLIVLLQKVGDSSAVFSIEMETYDNEKEEYHHKTIAFQYIPYTDIQEDCVEFFYQNGVVLFPDEL